MVTEPIARQVTRWSCPHCNRSWSKRRSASDHIERCWLNPDNRSCKTCINYVEPYACDSGYHCGCPVEPEHCAVGVEFEPHEYREGIIMLPLHCDQWKAA